MANSPKSFNKTDKNTDQKICRICLKNDLFKISLLCPYAQEENIIYRLEKYLQVKISLKEKSPKYICYVCYADLKFIEDRILRAKENQQYFEENQRLGTNKKMFEEESLLTPGENNQVDEINNNIYSDTSSTSNDKNRERKNKNIQQSTSTRRKFTDDSDSQHLFLPKVLPTQIKLTLPNSRKSFPFNYTNFEPLHKKVKTPEKNPPENNFNLSNISIKEETVDEKATSNDNFSGQHKLRLIKTFEGKFESLKKSK